jgi:hypothetical protein
MAGVWDRVSAWYSESVYGYIENPWEIIRMVPRPGNQAELANDSAYYNAVALVGSPWMLLSLFFVLLSIVFSITLCCTCFYTCYCGKKYVQKKFGNNRREPILPRLVNLPQIGCCCLVVIVILPFLIALSFALSYALPVADSVTQASGLMKVTYKNSSDTGVYDIASSFNMTLMSTTLVLDNDTSSLGDSAYSSTSTNMKQIEDFYTGVILGLLIAFCLAYVLYLFGFVLGCIRTIHGSAIFEMTLCMLISVSLLFAVMGVSMSSSVMASDLCYEMKQLYDDETAMRDSSLETLSPCLNSEGLKNVTDYLTQQQTYLNSQYSFWNGQGASSTRTANLIYYSATNVSINAALSNASLLETCVMQKNGWMEYRSSFCSVGIYSLIIPFLISFYFAAVLVVALILSPLSCLAWHKLKPVAFEYSMYNKDADVKELAEVYAEPNFHISDLDKPQSQMSPYRNRYAGTSYALEAKPPPVMQQPKDKDADASVKKPNTVSAKSSNQSLKYRSNGGVNNRNRL